MAELLSARLSPYDLGYLARESSRTLDDNPFREGTKPACEWFKGYDICDTEIADV